MALSSGGMSYIEEALFLGSYYAAKNRELLTGNNISAIVNVTEDVPNFFEADEESDQERTDEKGKGKEEPSIFSKFVYFNCSIADRQDQDLYQFFEAATSWIEERRQEGRGVLVHCRGGISRSPSIVLAYLVRFNNIPLSEALQRVQRARRIDPNPGFCDQLVRWEVKQRGNPSVRTQTSSSSRRKNNKPVRGGKGR